MEDKRNEESVRTACISYSYWILLLLFVLNIFLVLKRADIVIITAVIILCLIQESIIIIFVRSIEEKQSENNKGKEFRVQDGTLQNLPERLIYHKQISHYVFDHNSGSKKTLCVLSNEKDGIRVLFLNGEQRVPDKFAVLDKEVVNLDPLHDV